MANARYCALAPEQLLGVRDLAAKAGAASRVVFRTPQPTGHPHLTLFTLSTVAPIAVAPLQEASLSVG
jgi:hypothetical protein